MYKREKFSYYIKVLIPTDMFIISCKNQFRFIELKKYKCPIWALGLIFDNESYKVTMLDNELTKVDYELNYIDAYEKFDGEAMLILMDSADKYIESSSSYWIGMGKFFKF